MMSTLRSISNHYETLRVTPRASDDEIAQAFASQIRTARIRPDITVAQLAQISVAYETLRDPVRRRAYDTSLGLNAEPKVQAPPPPLPVTPEPRVASFIAASLRDPAKPSELRPQPDPIPEQWPIPKARAQSLPVPNVAPKLEPRTSTRPAALSPASPRLRVDLEFDPRDDARAISIDRRQATIGAGVAGLAILGLALALPHKQPVAPELTTSTTAAAAPAQAVTVGLPPATAPKDRPARPVQTAASSVTSALPVPQPDVDATSTDTPLVASTDQAQATQTASDQASTASDQTAATQTPAIADSTPAVTPAAATLPLPAATIARTIERIGYSCSSVVSSSTLSPGVFKIVCSSGDSYEAAPVHGRYRFHRAGSH
jgi:hypothetical protein